MKPSAEDKRRKPPRRKAPGISAKKDSGAAARVFRPERLLRGDTGVNPLSPLDRVSWIWAPDVPETVPPEGVFLRFRLEFKTPAGAKPPEIDVSADERFVLLLDGAEIGRGPHRSTVGRWLYQSWRVPAAAAPGRHVLEAVAWRLGAAAPSQQFSWRGGFALASGDPSWNAVLSTGSAPWKVARLRGTEPGGLDEDWVSGNVGCPFSVRGTSFLGEIPPHGDWKAPVEVRGPVWNGRPTPVNWWGGCAPGWKLYPSPLPDMAMSRISPGTFRTGPLAGSPPGPFSVPARSRAEILWDLGGYYCAFPELETSGGAGARVRWGWAEGLRGPDGLKLRNRDDWRGASFSGFHDDFFPDGRENAFFTTPWWRSGRWCRIAVETADEPLRVLRAGIAETRYPAEAEGKFECDDASLGPVQRICVRGLQECMHETFFDCPHYEQQMYVGDTRVQMLASAAMTADDRLVRRAADLFDESRRTDGISAMQFPARREQESATYAMVLPLVLRDAAMLHDCEAWLRVRAPGMRHLLHGISTYLDARGLPRDLPGWSFIDWAPQWSERRGVPPGGRPGEGASAPASFLLAMAFRAASEVEGALGERTLAAFWRAAARRTAEAAVGAFWDEGRGMVADDESHGSFSEHAQCLALLCGALRGERRRRAWRGLLEAPDLARCTVYFSHYLFETLLSFGRTDLFLKRLDLWREFASRGLHTPLEAPDCGKNGQKEPRSDCHAWGSHPLWHLHASVAGVRPASPFYRTVSVAPQPGPLGFLRSRTPTPRGPVSLDLRFGASGGVEGSVTLPPGLSGVFRWRGRTLPLSPGRNAVAVSRGRTDASKSARGF